MTDLSYVSVFMLFNVFFYIYCVFIWSVFGFKHLLHHSLLLVFEMALYFFNTFELIPWYDTSRRFFFFFLPQHSPSWLQHCWLPRTSPHPPAPTDSPSFFSSYSHSESWAISTMPEDTRVHSLSLLFPLFYQPQMDTPISRLKCPLVLWLKFQCLSTDKTALRLSGRDSSTAVPILME